MKVDGLRVKVTVTVDRQDTYSWKKIAEVSKEVTRTAELDVIEPAVAQISREVLNEMSDILLDVCVSGEEEKK